MKNIMNFNDIDRVGADVAWLYRALNMQFCREVVLS